ncbi:MAG: HPr(Ser) kinase/phosphatase [Betaproteobacteria bacterium]|nr:HPr(Ser) kinase/phosphatase [Betaproteobacteria bacterium]
MTQLTVQQLFDDTRAKLDLEWPAGRAGAQKMLTSDTVQKPTLALIGHLNFVHPNRVQVLGCAEMDYLRSLDGDALAQAITHLYSTELAAVIVANAEPVPKPLYDAAQRTQTPLLTSPRPSPELMNFLRHHLAQALAERISRHGVFLEVMGMGVLITGDSAIGKSELALELITRGHRLVADDMVDLYRVSPDTLEGRCPTVLQDFLEVRGLGILNIRALFGDIAVKVKKNLKLIVHLAKFEAAQSAIGEENRLHMHASTEDILDIPIPKVRIPVAAGRNLAVLVEVAVRNHIMHLRGLDASEQFIERQGEHIAANSHPAD